jgi:cytochrome d ubiquinol oxidase subunit I
VMALLALYGLYLVAKDKYEQNPLYLRLLIWAVALPYLASTTGWLFTEIARQPWIVFGLQLTANAVSPNVGAGSLALSLIGFTLVYGGLMAADVYLLVKFGRSGPSGSEGAAEPVEAPAGTPAGAYLK